MKKRKLEPIWICICTVCDLLCELPEDGVDWRSSGEDCIFCGLAGVEYRLHELPERMRAKLPEPWLAKLLAEEMRR